jgi:hypothetical protein
MGSHEKMSIVENETSQNASTLNLNSVSIKLAKYSSIGESDFDANGEVIIRGLIKDVSDEE